MGDVLKNGLDAKTIWTEVGPDNVESWRESGLDGERTYFYVVVVPQERYDTHSANSPAWRDTRTKPHFEMER